MTVIAGIEPETHNESKEEKEEITDISGIETSTEPDANKLNENKTEVIPDLSVGNPNIDTDDAGKPEPKPPANSRDTNYPASVKVSSLNTMYSSNRDTRNIKVVEVKCRVECCLGLSTKTDHVERFCTR